MGLKEYLPDTPLERTDREDYEAIDEKLVTSLVEDALPTMDHMAVERKAQVIETVRWFLAFDDVYSTRARRIEAQKRVAESRDITPSAVQEKVRKVYRDRYGKENAQELFDDDLDRIEKSYNARFDAR